MNSRQIEIVLNKHYATKKIFVGVFSADQLTTNFDKFLNNFPICFVANTDPSTLPGEHWIAFYARNRYEIEYFDSLAEPPNKNFNEFLQKFKRVIPNNHRVQNLFSNACGQFCIYFLIKRCLGLSFFNIVQFLLKIKNADLFVKNFVVNLLS